MAKEWTKKEEASNEPSTRERRRVQAAWEAGERGSQDTRVTSVAGINLK